jgi:hypothetical protein
MNKNTVARHSITRGAAQARRLLADTHLSSSVVAATTELSITAQVKRARALEDFRLGGLTIREGERFYFVASKFVGRYYIVLYRDGRWLCSSSDDRVQAAMVARVEAMLIQRKRAA